MRLAARGAIAASLFGCLAARSAANAQPAIESATVLRAGTPVPLVTLAEISSKTHKQGDRFELAVSEDVLVDGQVAIPRDARAIGEIAEHRAKGAFGRAGKLEIQLLHVEAAGRRIRLDGALADKGKDSAVPAIATGVIVAGVLGAAIKGKHASIPPGTRLTGYVHRDLPLAPAD